MRNTILAIVISLAVGLVGGWWFTTHRAAPGIEELKRGTAAANELAAEVAAERDTLEAAIVVLVDSLQTLEESDAQVVERIRIVQRDRSTSAVTVMEHLFQLDDTVGMKLFNKHLDLDAAHELEVAGRFALQAQQKAVLIQRIELGNIIIESQGSFIARVLPQLQEATEAAVEWERKANPPKLIRIGKTALPVIAFLGGVYLGSR